MGWQLRLETPIQGRSIGCYQSWKALQKGSPCVATYSWRPNERGVYGLLQKKMLEGLMEAQFTGSPLMMGKPYRRQVHKPPLKVGNPMEGLHGLPLKGGKSYEKSVHRLLSKIGKAHGLYSMDHHLRLKSSMEVESTGHHMGWKALQDGVPWGPPMAGKPYGMGVHRPSPKVGKLYRRAGHWAPPKPYRKVNRLPLRLESPM